MQDKKPKKNFIRGRIIIWISSFLIVALLIGYLHKQVKINRFNKVVSEYIQINNYQEAKDLFARDLKNNELKYFTYGMFYYKPFYRPLKKKYDLEIFHMGCIDEGILGKYNFYIENEVMKNNYLESIYFRRTDSIWTFFLESLDTKDINYLISNSSDSIIISNGLLNDSVKRKFEAKFLFENYSDKIASFYYLSKNAIDHDNDSLIYYFHKVDSLPSDKYPFNIRFCFIRKEDKYCFSELVML